MAEQIYQLSGVTLTAIVEELRSVEPLYGVLTTLGTKHGKNYARFKAGKKKPAGEIILVAARDGLPPGATKIGHSVLSISGVTMDVVAFREDTLPDRDGAPRGR